MQAKRIIILVIGIVIACIGAYIGYVQFSFLNELNDINKALTDLEPEKNVSPKETDPIDLSFGKGSQKLID